MQIGQDASAGGAAGARQAGRAGAVRAAAVAIALAVLQGGCGTHGGRVSGIPSERGNERAPIAQAASADELALRSAAERERGQAARAARFARWALALDPEHAGALVAAARVAADQGEHDEARRLYALAAADEERAGEVAPERARHLLAHARAELEAGRVEQAAALIEELEAMTPRPASVDRRDLARVHGELAEIWLARGLAGPGRAAAERAAALGADGDETRLRLLLAEVLAAGPSEARGGAAGLGAFEGRLGDELGRDAARWLVLSRWAARTGRFAAAAWAARRAGELEPEGAAAAVAACEAELGRGQEAEALEACQQAARRLAPAEGAALLVGLAERLGDARLVIAAAAAAAELAPGSDAGIAGAALAAYRGLALPEEGGPRGGTSAREAAIGVLVAAAGAAPGRWLEVIAPAQAKGDVRGVARVLAAARAAGLSDWTAHAFEVAQWRQVAAGSGPAQMRAEAEAGAAAAFEAALAARPGFFGLLELARLARAEGGMLARVRTAAEAAGQVGPEAYIAAVEVRGDLRRAREVLERELAGAGAFEAATVRAHFELEAGEPARAQEHADEAARVAGPEEHAQAMSLALRLALNGPREEIEARARAWLAAGDDVGVEATQRPLTLVRLIGRARGDLELQAELVRAALDEPRARWFSEPAQLRSQETALLQKLGRWEELEARWHAQLDALDDARAATEELVAWTAAERPELMVRFAARLHPEEIQRRELLPELVKQLVARGEIARARRVTERILGLPDAEGIGLPRLAALGPSLSAGALADLAARVYERLVALGDRSSATYAGWLKALVRLGQDARATDVAGRWLEVRPRRDARPLEEIVKALSEVGRLGTAIALYEDRLDKSVRIEPSSFNTLADLYVRSGRDAALEPLARRFIGDEARLATRLRAAAATRLAELGAVEEARGVVQEGLNLNPRDRALLQLEARLALAVGDEAAAIAGAERILRESGSAFDVWERVIGDVRADLSSEDAKGLIAQGLERFPGAHRLLALRGKVHLLEGQAELAFRDFAEALARAPSPRDVLDALEPMLERMSLFERLAELEARALSLTPGRADMTLMLGKALTAAGKVDAAGQVFQRVLGETDRAHGLVAEAWLSAGHLGAAIDAWAKLEPTTADDALTMLDNVATALGRRGEGARLDTFVRLYLQALRGVTAPPLGPIAVAHQKVGRPGDALVWLERAEREAPSADTALWAMRLRLAMGDRAGALVAAERAVARKVAQSTTARNASGPFVGALDAVVSELIAGGQGELARELVTRVAATHGASSATRLLGARALLAAGEIGGALAELAGPIEPWRQQRELMSVVQATLVDLVAHGQLEPALALVEAALEVGQERELWVAAIRIAARAGYPARAVAAAERLVASHPAMNGWLAGDVLASERLARAAEVTLREALGQGLGDAQLKQAALALTLMRGGDLAALEGVIGEIPRLAEDKLERALVEGFVAAALPDARGPERALQALMPILGRAALDPALVQLAALMASFAGSEEGDVAASDAARARALDALVARLGRGGPDETKLRLEIGAYLTKVRRPEAALVVYDRLLPSGGGDGALALEVFTTALAVGDEARARRWADKALGRVPSTAPPTLRARFAEAAARYGAATLAEELDAEAAAESWRRAEVRARLALWRDELGAFREAIEQRLMTSPDEAVARVQAAELVLVTRVVEGDASASRWREEALRLLAPLTGEEEAPAAALELAAVASGDGVAAAGLLARLRARYPEATGRPLLAVWAAVARGHEGGLAAVMQGLAPAPRRAALLEVLRARLAGGLGPVSAEVGRAIVREIERAPPNEPSAVGLEVALAALMGTPAAAVRAAEAAVGRAPYASELTLTLAEALVEHGGDARRAERLVREVMARPGELGLFEAEARFLLPVWSARAWEVLARVRARLGDQGGAERALERALAVAAEGEELRLGYLGASRGIFGAARAQAALRACVAAERAPWSALCAAELR